MNVILSKPHAWFLLQNGQDYYLDVNCAVSAVSFSVLVKLSAVELDDFAYRGDAAVDDLAQKIQMNPTSFSGRDVQPAVGEQVHNAIMRLKNA